MLEHALLNETDGEIANASRVSRDAVKKTWAKIYERATAAVPPSCPKVSRHPDCVVQKNSDFCSITSTFMRMSYAPLLHNSATPMMQNLA